MIEAIAALQNAASAEAPAAPGGAKVDLSIEPLQQPSVAQSVDFAHAAGAGPIHETQAALPPAADGVSGQIGHQMDALAHRLKPPEPAASEPAAATPPGAEPRHPAGLDNDKMAGAVSQMERAYMFAIETTMASRGSTELTKIFNTLLKGQ